MGRQVKHGVGLSSLLLWAICAKAQLRSPCPNSQVEVQTDKGPFCAPAGPHPLSWWTQYPLRLDPAGDLMIGYKAADDRPITAADYQVRQTLTTLGVLSGFRIVQVLTFIRPGKHVVESGFGSEQDEVVWEDLLSARVGSESFSMLHSAHLDVANVSVRTWKTSIYEAGLNAILGTYEPDGGNGGGCYDGYWWFDRRGPHEVDFKPLLTAISRAIPADANFTSRCWALDPERQELKSWVQKRDAICHTCGGLGTLVATYRIEGGVARPTSVQFISDPED